MGLITPSGANVKTVWSYNSTPPVCLCGMCKDRFTLLLIWVGCKENEKLGSL
jgi:hypothetical protein